MGMTIEESLNNLIELQADYQQFHDDVWQDPESYGIMAESLQMAISIIRRYQKIEKIIADWNDGRFSDAVFCSRVKEVVEDGTNEKTSD